MDHTLFISRKIDRSIPEWDLITDIGWKIIDFSLLKLVHISFELPEKFDWIFFSSKNAVHFFFDHLTEDHLLGLKTKKIAALGQATSTALKKYVTHIDYTGDGLFKDKEMFLRQVSSNEIILFPMAKNSRRYVQKQIGETRKCIDMYTYDNLQRDATVPKVDIALLTSPMNATSFLKNYSDDLSNVDFWSIGPATSNCLLHHGLDIIYTMSQPLESAWAKETFEYIANHYSS